MLMLLLLLLQLLLSRATRLRRLTAMMDAGFSSRMGAP